MIRSEGTSKRKRRQIKDSRKRIERRRRRKKRKVREEEEGEKEVEKGGMHQIKIERAKDVLFLKFVRSAPPLPSTTLTSLS